MESAFLTAHWQFQHFKVRVDIERWVAQIGRGAVPGRVSKVASSPVRRPNIDGGKQQDNMQLLLHQQNVTKCNIYTFTRQYSYNGCHER